MDAVDAGGRDFRAGYQAFLDGTPPEDYPPGLEKAGREAWHAGWMDAADDEDDDG